jgi:succinate dehydrogenase/fumarate reductase flavoprotein subunit
LIQHGTSREILGIRGERRGTPLNIKARKAVVLTCGGFENNQEMIRNYLPGIPCCYPSGTPHNEGDGIRMAQLVGGDLWHMNNYAGPSMALKVPEYKATFSMTPLHFSHELPGGMIVVGPDANRFTDEKYRAKHGKVRRNGQWLPIPVPCPMFMVFDHALFSAGPLYDRKPVSGWARIVERYEWSDDNRAELRRGWIKRAETVSALAASIGLSAAALGKSVQRWNRNCETGGDPDFGRRKMLAPIATPPYYAIELSPSMLNTQGGPRRNERGQIVRPDDTPIPRLYSAGELGSIYSHLYQGTRQHRRVPRFRPHQRAQRSGGNALGIALIG